MAKKAVKNDRHIEFTHKNGVKLLARDDVQAAAFKKFGFKSAKDQEKE
ncbi:hypothetical protein [Heyndrickxia camelliae]|nr:hypothetical protein [Heyndrickxia camelliae]